jgi:hypothetical protein
VNWQPGFGVYVSEGEYKHSALYDPKSRRQDMSTDRATSDREAVPTSWTELDDVFFPLVAELLSTHFLWGAAALLASYDPDDDAPEVTEPARPSRPAESLPAQRSLAA